MNRLTKALSLLLCLVLSVSLFACDTAAPSASQPGDASPNVSVSPAHSATPQPISGEITLSCFDQTLSKTFLDTAARRFEELNPGTKVIIESFSKMSDIKSADSEEGSGSLSISTDDDPQARADYINKVGADLMGGSGADLYAMDVLPIHKYVASGRLENLKTYIDGDDGFNLSDYRSNLFDAVSFGGGTWFLPLDYEFEYLAYDTTLLPGNNYGFGTDNALSASDMMTAGAAHFDPDTAAGIINSPSYSAGDMDAGLLGMLIRERYSELASLSGGTSSFVDGGFADLLERVSEYDNAGYLCPDLMSLMADPTMSIDELTALMMTEERYIFKSKISGNLQSAYTKNAPNSTYIFSMGGGMTAVEDDDAIAGAVALADGGVPFTYSQGYGINSDSKNKATAWAFLKFLLSEEMQSSASLSYTGFPVNNAARLALADTQISSAFGTAGTHTPESEQALRDYTDALERLSGSISTYLFRDTIIDDMITDEVQFYIDGTKTADDVATALQNKAALYLSE